MCLVQGLLTASSPKGFSCPLYLSGVSSPHPRHFTQHLPSHALIGYELMAGVYVYEKLPCGEHKERVISQRFSPPAHTARLGIQQAPRTYLVIELAQSWPSSFQARLRDHKRKVRTKNGIALKIHTTTSTPNTPVLDRTLRWLHNLCLVVVLG